jgi:hypothetical protein
MERSLAGRGGPAAAHTDLKNKVCASLTIHRLRKRYRNLFRQEIADTVGDPAEVESDLRYIWRPC